MQQLTRRELRIGATALVLSIATVVGLVATAETGPPTPSNEIRSNHIQATGEKP